MTCTEFTKYSRIQKDRDLKYTYLLLKMQLVENV